MDPVAPCWRHLVRHRCGTIRKTLDLFLSSPSHSPIVCAISVSVSLASTFQKSKNCFSHDFLLGIPLLENVKVTTIPCHVFARYEIPKILKEMLAGFFIISRCIFQKIKFSKNSRNQSLKITEIDIPNSRVSKFQYFKKKNRKLGTQTSQRDQTFRFSDMKR